MHIIKLILVLIGIIGIHFNVHTQNLFPNPSFEEYEDCPTSLTEIEKCLEWSCISGTPDYFNCSYYGVLSNSLSTVYAIPSLGDGLIGMLGMPNTELCDGGLYKESIFA